MSENVLSSQLSEITMEFTLTRDCWQELMKLVDAWHSIYGTDQGRRLSMEMHDVVADINQALEIDWIQ